MFMARLIISSPDGKNGILELNKPVITVGRGNANDLVLNDSSVSRFHAVIKLRDNSIFVADRGSTNGIVLNDTKINKETELKDGDVALVGQYQLRLENVDEKGHTGPPGRMAVHAEQHHARPHRAGRIAAQR